jgi:hypothetical protein
MKKSEKRKFFIQNDVISYNKKSSFLSHQYLIFISKNRTIRLFSVIFRINNIGNIRYFHEKLFFSTTYILKRIKMKKLKQQIKNIS